MQRRHQQAKQLYSVYEEKIVQGREWGREKTST